MTDEGHEPRRCDEVLGADHRGARRLIQGVGILALALAALTGWWFPQHQTLVALFVLIAFAATLTALLLPRPITLTLTPAGLRFEHAAGHYQLPWSAIVRIDQVRLGLLNHYRELPYVGIRLHSPTPLLSTLSIRLAARLMVDQRDLLYYAEKEGAVDARLDWEKDRVRLADGQEYDGVVAMFSHRMMSLRQHLGYDLYLPVADLELDATDLLTRLNRYFQQYRHQEEHREKA